MPTDQMMQSALPKNISKIGSDIMDKELLCNVMPIVEKASPFIASLLGGYKTSIVIGLLGMLVNCDPNNKEDLISKLEKDQDLFSKLKNLETTHAQWLNGLQ